MPDKTNASRHRTTVDVAPERKEGKRLADRYQFRGYCLCGWIGPTMPTAQEARTTAWDHRQEERANEREYQEWLRRENERAAAHVSEPTYIPYA